MIITNTDRVRAELEKRIVSGELVPGTMLDESRLGQQFEVSRTPVREALLQLSAEGFVRIVPRAGIYVVELPAREIAELFEALAHSEGLCAALACERGSVHAMERILEVHASGRAAVAGRDLNAYREYNLAFHEALYFACANRFLTRQVLYIRKRLNPYQQKFATLADDWLDQSFDIRERFVQALTARDQNLAREYAAGDILEQAGFFLQVGESTPDYLYFSTPAPRFGERARAELSNLFTPAGAAIN